MLGKKTLVVFGAIVVMAAVGACLRASFVRSGRIAPGVVVAGVKLGGMAPADAEAILRDWSRSRMSEEFVFIAYTGRWKGKLSDVGVIPDTKAMLAKASAVGRKGNVLTQLLAGFGISGASSRVAASYRYDYEKIDSLFTKIDKEVATPPKDARIVFVDGVRKIEPDTPGTSVDSSQSYKLIEDAVTRGVSTISLPILPKAPQVKTADLEKVDTLLASFTTVYPGWKKGRTHNIHLAVNGVDGELVQPGQIFSYNKAVGPRLKKYGFQDAPIYVNGKIIPGTGGGICQVSSTVYNTALLAGLRIVERSHHSMKVPYVPLGRDATVAYGLLDLKFENNTTAPIYISAAAARSRLIVNIYGTSDAKKAVRIVTTHPKRIQRPNGKLVTAVTVYRVVSENGVDVQRERVSSDRYNPAPPHDAPAPKVRTSKVGAQG